MVFSNSTQTYIPTEDKQKQKKWSTFLMKPDRPQPTVKKTEEQIKIEGDPYKVLIKKQSRRKSLPKEKRVQFDQNIIEVEIESLSSRNQDSPEMPISPDPDSLGYEHDPDSLDENNSNSDYVHDYVKDNEDYEEYDENQNETDFDDQIRKDSLSIKFKPISEIIIDDPNSENAMTLADQLKSLQKQLEVLSLLPSEVQPTLDAVSKQLASIVGTNEDEEENEENRDVSVSAEAQADGNTEDGEDSIVGDELEEDSVTEEELQTILERAKLEDRDEEEEQPQENLEEINEINEEELEEKRKEEELLAKKEKEMATTTPKSNFRPIVLPGGRKWIDPDDVVPKRKSKMTDEMIMESIESNLEVIAGKRKGINFMKNAPPPKNLDHLQRSEVYRMIHGMELPTRGITIRPEKVLPEQDYYEANRGAS